MGKKRKHSETEAAAASKKDDSAPERPKRTLLGWKDKAEDAEEPKPAPGFRNKEKAAAETDFRPSQMGIMAKHAEAFIREFLDHSEMQEIKIKMLCYWTFCRDVYMQTQ